MAKKLCLICLVGEGITVQDTDWLIECLETEMEANRDQKGQTGDDDFDESYKQLEEIYNKVKKLKAKLLDIPVEQV